MTGETGKSDTWLLVSDIDDTLTGSRADLERLWHQLKNAKSHLKLALNSSRPAASVDQTLADYFPEGFEPNAIITGLGTEIRLDRFFLESWQSRFIDWPDEEVRKIVRKLGYDAHDDKFQTDGKASFAVPGKDGVDAILAALRDEGIPFRHIYSGTSDLDIFAPAQARTLPCAIWQAILAFRWSERSPPVIPATTLRCSKQRARQLRSAMPARNFYQPCRGTRPIWHPPTMRPACWKG